MICPVCKGGFCRRSRRKKLADYTLGLAGMRPWRCRACERRFYAWTIPPRYLLNTHCTRCGNMDLQMISREHVTEGLLRWMWGLLRVPAYRCQPCRRRFFSLRPYRRVVPETPSLPEEAAATAAGPVPSDSRLP